MRGSLPLLFAASLSDLVRGTSLSFGWFLICKSNLQNMGQPPPGAGFLFVSPTVSIKFLVIRRVSVGVVDHI